MEAPGSKPGLATEAACRDYPMQWRWLRHQPQGARRRPGTAAPASATQLPIRPDVAAQTAARHGSIRSLARCRRRSHGRVVVVQECVASGGAKKGISIHETPGLTFMRHFHAGSPPGMPVYAALLNAHFTSARSDRRAKDVWREMTFLIRWGSTFRLPNRSNRAHFHPSRLARAVAGDTPARFFF